ncbi:MAG: 30S ribosomal protein S9 [Phycisphaerae bacterium]|nr:30S ribosomal protein S9 [Phycisphaerae bacterium]
MTNQSELTAPAQPTQSAEEVAASVPPPPPGTHFLGTGRRKSSVARVRLVAGTGRVLINKRPLDAYFTEILDRNDVDAPFEATRSRGRWDAHVNVYGGGHTGQAGAIRLGIARALVRFNEKYEPALRSAGYLTRDSREVERKKYGQRKARRRFQFSKR